MMWRGTATAITRAPTVTNSISPGMPLPRTSRSIQSSESSPVSSPSSIT
jgi:hypothetical protein